jgi:hypothetical protein
MGDYTDKLMEPSKRVDALFVSRFPPSPTTEAQQKIEVVVLIFFVSTDGRLGPSCVDVDVHTPSFLGKGGLQDLISLPPF